MDGRIERILRGAQFMRLYEEQLMELRQKYDMKKAELEILYFLSRCGGKNTSTDIHHQLSMNRGHISQAVDGLCRKKYLTAVPDAEDRRYVHYELTDAAFEIAGEVSRRYEEISKEILKGVTEEEMRVLERVSDKIWNNMQHLI